MSQTPYPKHGALVGWVSTSIDDRLSLRLQSVTSPPPHSEGQVHSHIYMMDRNQAAQLADYLFEICGQSRPSRRGRGWFARMFG
ncbi:MAG: hypothetical protein JY451_04595 [Erythrobacter sp.]|nr:MAG: hypothetical protein JY451_04595 [Erythrobacter sp.]